jgi:hypothetical protein
MALQIKRLFPSYIEGSSEHDAEDSFGMNPEEVKGT